MSCWCTLRPLTGRHHPHTHQNLCPRGNSTPASSSLTIMRAAAATCLLRCTAADLHHLGAACRHQSRNHRHPQSSKFRSVVDQWQSRTECIECKLLLAMTLTTTRFYMCQSFACRVPVACNRRQQSVSNAHPHQTSLALPATPKGRAAPERYVRLPKSYWCYQCASRFGVQLQQ